MKKNIKKHLSLLMAVVMAISALTLVACNPNRTDSDTDAKDNGASHALAFETQSSPFVSLSATTATRATANGNVLEHVLTATVLPESAENKDVRWTVRWEDTSRTENVSAYVKAITTSPYGNVATVTCYRPFTGNIVITATTVQGGFTAQCICKYVGTPTAMSVDLSDLVTVKDTAWNIDIVEVVSNTTTYHEISFTDRFGEMGAEFVPEYEIYMEAFGGVLTESNTYDAEGNLIGTELVENTLEATHFFASGYYNAHFPGKYLVNFVHVGMRDGQIYISAYTSPDAISREENNADGTVTRVAFDSYIGGKEPYARFTVTEKNTGLSYTFNVRTVAAGVAVQGVTLDQSEIIF